MEGDLQTIRPGVHNNHISHNLFIITWHATPPLNFFVGETPTHSTMVTPYRCGRADSQHEENGTQRRHRVAYVYVNLDHNPLLNTSYLPSSILPYLYFFMRTFYLIPPPPQTIRPYFYIYTQHFDIVPCFRRRRSYINNLW